ncbi:MAG: hypothetical protein OIF50_07945 [Flavobacteriaceae bacterium]|nr:hypothetical protein [Flavobacteriaceae bacterium]
MSYKYLFILSVLFLVSCKKQVKYIRYFESTEAFSYDSIIEKAPYLREKVKYKNIPHKILNLYYNGSGRKREEDIWKIEALIEEKYKQKVTYTRIRRNDTVFVYRNYLRYLEKKDSIVKMEDFLAKNNLKQSQVKIIHKIALRFYSPNIQCYIIEYDGFRHEIIFYRGRVIMQSHPIEQQYFWEYFGFYMNYSSQSEDYIRNKKSRRKEYKALVRSQGALD